MLEIGFDHKIAKLNFVSHSKISLENLTKKIYDQTYQKKWKKVEKSGKTLISSLVGKISYFRVFPLFGAIFCQMILFSNILRKVFNGKQNLVYVFCDKNPISSTLSRDQTLEIYSCRIIAVTLFFFSQSPKGTV